METVQIYCGIMVASSEYVYKHFISNTNNKTRNKWKITRTDAERWVAASEKIDNIHSMATFPDPSKVNQSARPTRRGEKLNSKLMAAL